MRSSSPSPLTSLVLVGLLLLSGCSSTAVQLEPTLPGPTVTPDLNVLPSPTPFQPFGTLVPLNTPVLTPPTITPLPVSTSTQAATGTELPPVTPPTDTPTAMISQTLVPGLRAQYYLNAFVDYAANTVRVGELIGYPNQTGQSLTELVLAVEPNLWSGGFIMDALAVNGVPADYILSGGRLDIPLAQPLEPGVSLTLSLEYHLVLPYAGTTNIYGYNTLQVNLLDWYPYVVPYDPLQGWLYHDKSVVGEHLVYDMVDFDVTLQLDDPTLVVAAGAPAQWTERGWHYALTGRSFALSISDAYQTASTAAGSVTVTAYYFAGESAAANALLQETAKAVVTYADYFAPAPYTTLSIVEAAAYGDGMESDGLFFLGRKFYLSYTGTVQCDLIAIGVHEAAHNWWFGLVGSDQALEPWLDEALALYSEHIFYEANYPGLVNWWWNFRVNHYQPTGWVDNTIYTAGPFRSYVNSVYLRGADFLDALRLRIGDEAFLAFIKDYADQMSGQRATSADFFRILRLHTTVDFTDITTSFFQVPR